MSDHVWEFFTEAEKNRLLHAEHSLYCTERRALQASLLSERDTLKANWECQYAEALNRYQAELRRTPHEPA